VRKNAYLRALLVPPTPGNPDGYQKKGVAGGAICMNVKRQDLVELGSLERDWRQKWGQKFRMRID